MRRIAGILLTVLLTCVGCSDNGVSPGADSTLGRVVIWGNLTRSDTGEESRVSIRMDYDVRSSFSSSGYLSVITDPVRLTVSAQDPILMEGASALDSKAMLLSFSDRPDGMAESRGNLTAETGDGVRWRALFRSRHGGWFQMPPGDVFATDGRVQISVNSEGQYYSFYGTGLVITVTGVDRSSSGL